jgi:hypothetical protein
MKRKPDKKTSRQTDSDNKRRKKVLLVPFLRRREYDDVTGALYDMVIFQDTLTREWTLLSGGRKMTETAFECALREIREETYGTFQIDEACCSTLRFTTAHRPEQFRIRDKGRLILSDYDVYVFEMTPEEYAKRSARYKAAVLNLTSKQSRYGETVDVRLMSSSDIASAYMSNAEDSDNSVPLWDFIRHECLKRVDDHILHFHDMELQRQAC